MKKMNIDRLPELRTRVGMHGSVKQQEVGGAYCAAVVIAVVTG